MIVLDENIPVSQMGIRVFRLRGREEMLTWEP